jgi:hypothetical protein
VTDTFGWTHGAIAQLAEDVLAALGERPTVWFAEGNERVTRVIWYVGERGLVRAEADEQFTRLDASLIPWSAVTGWSLSSAFSGVDRRPPRVTLRLEKPDLVVAADTGPATAYRPVDAALSFVNAVRDRLALRDSRPA